MDNIIYTCDDEEKIKFVSHIVKWIEVNTTKLNYNVEIAENRDDYYLVYPKDYYLIFHETINNIKFYVTLQETLTNDNMYKDLQIHKIHGDISPIINKHGDTYANNERYIVWHFLQKHNWNNHIQTHENMKPQYQEDNLYLREEIKELVKNKYTMCKPAYKFID